MIGERLRRREDGPLITGRAQYLADLQRPGLLHVGFLRSPLAHARIERIAMPPAGMVEGLHGVFTAAELRLPPLAPPIENPHTLAVPRPLLADSKVRFAGEAVAVAVADSRYLAEDAMEAIEVEYCPLEPLADPLAALRPDAPRLHDHPTNVVFEREVAYGDVERAFAEAEVVLGRSFRSPRYCATPLEPRGVLAELVDGTLEVRSSTQVPYQLRSVLCRLLGLPEAGIRVVNPDVGGGFGQKCHVYPEEVVVAWLALRLGRPIAWIEDRAENLLASSHARDQRLRVRLAADRDGRLRALEAEVLCDVGAYGVYPHGHILEALGTVAMLPGPYRWEAFRARSRAVATNKCPEGAYRGVGQVVSAFVYERLMDILAAELGLGRAEVRRRNLINRAELPYTTLTGQRYDSGDYAQALDAVLRELEYERFDELQAEARRRGRRLGVGFACYVESTALGSAAFGGRGWLAIRGDDAAHVRLEHDGRVCVFTTLPSIGQGVETTFAQMVAYELDVPTDSIVVKRPDTAVGNLQGTGTFASRSAVAGGGAIRLACHELRRRLLEDAAELLEVGTEDLVLADGLVHVAGAAERAIAVRQLVERLDDLDRYAVSQAYDPEQAVYPSGVHGCIVEVDGATGRVEILRYAVAEDCGRVINPLIVEGQVHGATAQGIGAALLEELVYDDQGQLQNASMMDYLIPTLTDMPNLVVHHQEIPSPATLNGTKGVGEGGTLGPGPALANAVSHALGAEFNALPLRPEDVRRAAATG